MIPIKFGLGMAAVLAVAGFAAWYTGQVPTPREVGPETVLVPSGATSYRVAGQFLAGNRVIDAPLEQYIAASFEIMKYQVSGTEYAGCVADGICLEPLNEADGTTAQTGVSFNDAMAFANWLSERTGETWRLPTDREWSRAAGERYHDDALGLTADDADPSKRWLLAYQSQTGRTADRSLREMGAFGENAHGLADMSGNIWEWTTGCYQRGHYSEDGISVVSVSENCGVRIAQGKHRAYIVDFVRDANVGGCAVGLPPDYLGFRLVRDRS